MKKLVALMLAAVMTISLAACGAQEENADVSVDTEAEQEETEQEETESEVYNIGQTRLTDSVNVREGSAGWSIISHGLGESVYKLDANGAVVSRFVSSIEQTDDYNWALELNQGVYFSDGTEVNAEAFCEGLNKQMELNELAPVGAAGKMTFTATGDYSVTVTTEKVTKVLTSNLTNYTIVVNKELEDGTIIYTGPYAVKNYEAGVKLEMVPNAYYPDAEKRSDVNILLFSDASAMQLAFESGELDMAATVTADVAGMLNDKGLTTEAYDAGYQYFMHCNMQEGPLSDLKVRQALNYAINREDMIKVLKGGRVATGLFATYYSFAGDCATTTDVEAAKALLDEAGWTVGDDGIREKDGEKMELRFVTYGSRPDLPVLMQLVVSQLEAVGIKCKAEVVDGIVDTLNSGDWDLSFYATHTANTGDPVFYLESGFFKGGAENYTGFYSEEFESIVTQMGTLPFGEERDELCRQAQQLIYEELPVIFCIDPQWHIAVSDRLEGYKPYCGDYYLITEDLGI